MGKDNPNIISRLFSSVVFFINVCAAVWLLLCVAAAFISPAKVPYLALFSLTAPFAVIVNIIFIVLWLFSSHRSRLLLSLLALIAGYKVVITLFGFNYFGENDMSRRPGTIKIMSWNAHGMGIFNKPQDKAFDQRILNFLHEENPDILCLPEYCLSKENAMKPYAGKITENGHYVDFRFQPDNSLNNKVYLGTAVFSKYPFKNYVTHQLADWIYMMQGDVELPDSSIMRVFFVHLTTFGLSDKDKDYIDDVKRRNTDIENDVERSKGFISKFNNAFAKRAAEADKASRIISESPYPVLLCGDFNDLPGSYTYTTLRGQLKDAFLEKGKGFGRSYNRILPTLRIDHFFYDPRALRLIGFQCPPTTLSDHNPLITNFEIISGPHH